MPSILTGIESANLGTDIVSCNGCKCNKQEGKYVCPRCNVLYCSVQCYRSTVHEDCSESFYRGNLIQYIKSVRHDPQSRKNILEILRSCQESALEDSDEEEEIPDLSERLHNVNLDDAELIWQKLTLAEREEFEEILQSGDASELIPPWEPWWLFRVEKKLVEEVHSEPQTAKIDDYINRCPKVKDDMPAFNSITKSLPSPCVKYNVINVLAAYCYVARFFNGEHQTIETESSGTLISISGNLSSNHNYSSAVTAVGAVSHEVTNYPWLGGTDEATALVKKDVECILAGPEHSNCAFYLLAALSDIHTLLRKAQHSKHDGTRKCTQTGDFSKKFMDHHPFPVSTKEKLKQCLRKLEYYLSWSKYYAGELCGSFLIQ